MIYKVLAGTDEGLKYGTIETTEPRNGDLSKIHYFDGHGNEQEIYGTILEVY